MRESARRAFTLIELLVVVAIIGMLIALVFPSLQRALQRASSAGCMNNLHQIGVAVQEYVADPANAYQYPAVYNTSANSADYSSSGSNSPLQPLACLGQYGLTLRDLTCPADRNPDPVYGSYIWSPVIQGEQAQSPVIYTPMGAFTVQKLGSLTLCTDNGRPHLGKFNVLRADGHVDTKP